MLTRFFRQDQPTAYLPFPLLILLLWPGAGTTGGWPFKAAAGVADQVVTGMPLYAPVRWLMEQGPWAAFGASLLLVLGVSHSLNRMANDTELFDRRNHLPVLLFPLLLSICPFGLVPGPALLGAWALIGALARTWTSLGRKNILSALFDAGLLLGIAGLFYLPYAFLVVVIWATLSVTRPVNWREYVLPLIGMAVMLFLGWGAVHFIAPGTWHPVASMHFAPDTPVVLKAHWMYNVILVAVLLILTVSVLVSFAAIYARSVTWEKNLRASFLAFAFAMGLLALFAWWLDQRVPPVLLALPAALLLTYPLLQAKRTAWADAAVWSLILLACWARWAG